MTILQRILIVFPVIACGFPLTDVYASDKSNAVEMNANTTEIVANNAAHDSADREMYMPWRSSVFVSAGYGYPQGGKLEVGYTFGDYFSIAIPFSVFDYWSRDASKVQFGLCAQGYVHTHTTATPYALLGAGTSFGLFGNYDSYELGAIGAKFVLKQWLQLCPELGMIFTSRYVSGGLFSTATYTYANYFYANLGLEIDLKNVF